jgi:predicted nucleic acid-binding protein
MILIADSSALITLSIIKKLEILEKLFGDVFIPQAVFNEITKVNKRESPELKEYCQNRIKTISTNINFNISLGIGESEAIILYKEMEANFFLCDDKKAKKFAKSFNINVIGSLGVLLKAKETGYVTKIKPLVEILKQSNIFIDDKIYRLVLAKAKELDKHS